MKKKILVSSTSNIVSNIKMWSKITLNYDLEFLYNNNLKENFNASTKHDIFIFIIFIQDFIDNLSENKIKNKKLNIVFDNLVYLIKRKIKNFKGQIIVMISSYEQENIVNISKNDEDLSVQLKKKINKLNSKNILIIDLDKIFSFYGFQNVFDYRNLYLANTRLSLYGTEILITQTSLLLERITASAKKILILDCDNTLWGGVIGEDGIENLQLGQDGPGKVYVDFQKQIKKLSKDGIILCVCSKNNHDDVMQVFKNHSEMILKEEDILMYKVNWKEKYKNILEISRQLSLGLDSIVFWDDNPIEREKIRKFLPKVNTVEPNKEIVQWPNQIKNLTLFSKFNVTKEDKTKVKQYKMRSQFLTDKNNSKEEMDYLRSIKLEAKLINISKDNIDRAAQLTMKTNQFNLRTIRYTQQEIIAINKNKKNIVSLVSLNDIYGDHGIIALIIVKNLENNDYFLDTFLMSCRVLGRKLETWIFRELLRILEKRKAKTLYAEYIDSKKNNLVKDLLEKHNFEKIKNTRKLNFLNNNNNHCYKKSVKKVNYGDAEIYDG